ncbi:hypothetical protein ABUE30_04480 [Celerinatantimonas yamalensis]|uniref:Uncharacterized protein n=1 Tax=Celerinatantimonas yamalensis TaxID=559956 RepID=A0ABW9G513_9GAMM
MKKLIESEQILKQRQADATFLVDTLPPAPPNATLKFTAEQKFPNRTKQDENRFNGGAEAFKNNLKAMAQQ